MPLASSQLAAAASTATSPEFALEVQVREPATQQEFSKQETDSKR